MISPPEVAFDRAGPSRLNGDARLSSDERQCYLKFHRERNRRNSHLSRVERVKVAPMPCPVAETDSLASPSRVAMDSFVRWAGTRMAAWFGDRAVRVLDIGCGNGYARELLTRAGLYGEYVGVDHAEHPGFGAFDCAAFAPRLIVGDVHALEPGDVGPVDLLISMTALEHFEDDLAALARARRLLAPGAAELHVVPAERGLRLWGCHGWRQYSPRCVQRVCPRARIYAISGAVSAWVHELMITRPDRCGKDGRKQRPRVYRTLRRWSHPLDRMLSNRPASLYAAVVWPGGDQA